jgi:hypothetical protein
MAVVLAASAWGANAEKPKTPEQKAWEDVDSLSKESLQGFLKAFPDGKLAQQAKTAIELQDKLTAIREGKSKADFAIPLDALGNRWASWQKRIPVSPPA